MPGFDGTGPMGAGPLTGGGRGYCGPYGSTYGFYGPGFRAGFGPGWGYGRGFGWSGYAPPYAYPYGAPYPYAVRPEDELNMLKNQADMIRADLDAIKKRIESLESASDSTA